MLDVVAVELVDWVTLEEDVVPVEVAVVTPFDELVVTAVVVAEIVVDVVGTVEVCVDIVFVEEDVEVVVWLVVEDVGTVLAEVVEVVVAIGTTNRSCSEVIPLPSKFCDADVKYIPLEAGVKEKFQFPSELLVTDTWSCPLIQM